MAVISTSCCVSLLLIALPCFFLPIAYSASFIVGGSSGWSIPSDPNLNYAKWAASYSFHVGDSLVFNYEKEAHTVLQVTRSSYRYCNTTGPQASFSDGKTTIKLSQNGSHYFICGVAGHCQAGQKLQVKVLEVGQVGASQAVAAPSPAPMPGGGGGGGGAGGGAATSPVMASASASKSATTSIMLLGLLIGFLSSFYLLL